MMRLKTEEVTVPFLSHSNCNKGMKFRSFEGWRKTGVGCVRQILYFRLKKGLTVLPVKEISVEKGSLSHSGIRGSGSHDKCGDTVT